MARGNDHESEEEKDDRKYDQICAGNTGRRLFRKRQPLHEREKSKRREKRLNQSNAGIKKGRETMGGGRRENVRKIVGNWTPRV